MIGELDFYGVLISPLLLWAVLAFAVMAVLRRLLAVVGFYHLVWHRPLFDLGLYVIILGLVALVLSREAGIGAPSPFAPVSGLISGPRP
jgi:hypothetical protein